MTSDLKQLSLGNILSDFTVNPEFLSVNSYWSLISIIIISCIEQLATRKQTFVIPDNRFQWLDNEVRQEISEQEINSLTERDLLKIETSGLTLKR
jgi:hypothetical protein